MVRSYRLGPSRRLVNVVVRGLLRVGVAGRHTYLLSVPGRRSGRVRSTPVNLVEDGGRWLVAPYGEVSWVRNARAAGSVTLSRGRRREQVTVSEVAAQEAARVRQTYLRQVRVVRPFFDVSPQSPLEEYVTEAHRHPVFRIEPK